MSETAKTLTFVLTAAVAVGLAVFVNMEPKRADVGQLVGTMLNEGIQLRAPRRLQIARFDRATAKVRQFEVAELEGVWSIPSKENYPADATEQMAQAASCVINRKILRVAGNEGQSHAEFGVIDPLAAKLDSKSVGVGTHVTMTDAEDKVLVDMIVGKEVKDNPTQRYVRRANQDVVYVVDLDPSKLSTEFADWIEDDLLKLEVMDLRAVDVNDYTADLGIGIGPGGQQALTVVSQVRGRYKLTRDAEGAPWSAASLQKADPTQRGYAADALADDEEVNQQAINDLVAALDELLIVDVARKPEGLSADLKAGEAFLKDRATMLELIQKGFMPNPEQRTGADLLSSEGEVVCTLRNGVEYVLRFGQLQLDGDSDTVRGDEDVAEATPAAGADGTDPAAAVDPAAITAAADAAAEAAAKAEGENLRRYIFVMARFNVDAVEKPQYQELPTAPAPAAGETEPADAAAADGEATSDEPADAAAEGAAEATTDDAAIPPTGEDAEGPPSPQVAAEETDPGAGDAAAGDEDEAVADESAEGTADAAEAGATAEGAEGAADATDARAAFEAERAMIEQENERAREEYETLISEGQQKVAELNARFGDWYYVISNDVFKKIHLGRDQVIQKKGAAAPAAGGAEMPAGLQGLQGLQGLEGLVPPAPNQ
jgi:hypothetical protein